MKDKLLNLKLNKLESNFNTSNLLSYGILFLIVEMLSKDDSFILIFSIFGMLSILVFFYYSIKESKLNAMIKVLEEK